MAIEYVILSYATAAEAIMLLLLTMPGLGFLRTRLNAVTRRLLKPFLSIIPFCMFLLMDIYFKYETEPSCIGHSCTPLEYIRHQKSLMKSQRNTLLIATALGLYWILWRVSGLVIKIEQLNQRAEKLENKNQARSVVVILKDYFSCVVRFLVFFGVAVVSYFLGYLLDAYL